MLDLSTEPQPGETKGPAGSEGPQNPRFGTTFPQTRAAIGASRPCPTKSVELTTPLTPEEEKTLGRSMKSAQEGRQACLELQQPLLFRANSHVSGVERHAQECEFLRRNQVRLRQVYGKPQRPCQAQYHTCVFLALLLEEARISQSFRTTRMRIPFLKDGLERRAP